jgi:hypothetical protein
MQIYPRDLGTERYLSILRRRFIPTTLQGAYAYQSNELALSRTSGRPARLRKRLGRYWVRGLDLDEKTGEEAAALTWGSQHGVGVRVGLIIVSTYLLMGFFITLAAGAPFPIPPLLFLAWLGLCTAMLTAPRQALKRADEKALTVSEVEALLPTARGRLERMYLNLVADAMRQEGLSASAQSDIRAALRYLGETISRLPAEAVPHADASTLRQEAQERRSEAARETDSFVQKSLLRQAEALEERATLAEQNGLSARRLSALRREARAHMDALRAVLVGYQQLGQTDTASAEHLSHTVQRIASEAEATAVAHRELDEDEIARLFGAPLPTPVAVPVAPQNQMQQVGTQAQQPAPQQQPVSSRQWWRNP